MIIDIVGYIEHLIVRHPTSTIPNKHVQAIASNVDKDVTKRWTLIQSYLDSRARFLQSLEKTEQ